MKLKIVGELADVGGHHMRYSFSISPLTPDSGKFTFIHHCEDVERDKSNKQNSRKLIAAVLKMKHQACWERYHAWRELHQ